MNKLEVFKLNVDDTWHNWCSAVMQLIQRLEKVAIANALQLEVTRRHASTFPLYNYDAMPSLKSLNSFIAVL